MARPRGTFSVLPLLPSVSELGFVWRRTKALHLGEIEQRLYLGTMLMMKRKKRRISSRTKLKNWSKAVRERDGNRCFVCGSDYHCQAHHICQKKMWSDLKYDLNNGITLCCKHHSFGKFSVHRGTDLLLIEKLLNERPSQYRYLLEAIHEELEKKQKDESV